MHQRVIRLPTGGKVNVPGWLIGSIEHVASNTGILCAQRRKLVQEDISSDCVTRPPFANEVLANGDLVENTERRCSIPAALACRTPQSTRVGRELIRIRIIPVRLRLTPISEGLITHEK